MAAVSANSASSPGVVIAAVGPAVEADSIPFKLREVSDGGAALDEKAAMAERDHWEDRQADKIPVAVRGLDHEPAERRLAARARRIVGDGPEAMMHIVLEVDTLWDDIASQ